MGLFLVGVVMCAQSVEHNEVTFLDCSIAVQEAKRQQC